jgi:hypothetical protein
MSNSNANNIWAKTKHPNETWSWVSCMGSEECQSLAGQDGTFFRLFVVEGVARVARPHDGRTPLHSGVRDLRAGTSAGGISLPTVNQSRFPI